MQNDHMRKLLFLHNQSTIFTKDMNMKSKYLYSQETLEGGSFVSLQAGVQSLVSVDSESSDFPSVKCTAHRDVTITPFP